MKNLSLCLVLLPLLVHAMEDQLPAPVIYDEHSAQQHPGNYVYPNAIPRDCFVKQASLYDNDPNLTDELVESIYNSAPPRIRTIVKTADAKFDLQDMIPNNCLLLGPSGCGKTMLAKVMAIKLNRPYKLIRTPLLFDEYKNSTITALKNIIQPYIDKNKKVVLIFDEMNAITDKQDIKNDPDATTSSAFWLLLDECLESKKIFIIGTSNKQAKDLPTQFQTRFANNSKVTIPLPSPETRLTVINFYLNNQRHNCNKNYIKKLVKTTAKKSSREIKSLIAEAAQNASERDSELVIIEPRDIERVIKSWPSAWKLSISYEDAKPYLHQLPSQVIQIFLFALGQRFQQKVFNWQQETSAEQINLQREGIRLQKTQVLATWVGAADWLINTRVIKPHIDKFKDYICSFFKWRKK